MREARSILIVGGDEPCAAMASSFAQRGYQCATAADAPRAVERFRDSGADLIVLSLPVAGSPCSQIVGRLRAVDRRAVIVAVGLDVEIRSSADALRAGLDEYVESFQRDAQKLLSAIGITLGVRKEDTELRYMREKSAAGAAGWTALVGDCPAIRRVLSTVHQLCRRTASGQTPTVLITGETGSGKGLLARCIHYNSVRRNQPFVDVNCAAIPPTLMEAELLGHERGAFTGAGVSRAGLFETADGGTIFLDEIGSLTPELQAKLLTAVEEKRIRRVGGRRTVQIDVQVISATHGDLVKMVEAGQFRADLFHRLNVVSVGMPSLRERGDDKALLAETFVQNLCREYGIPPRRLSAGARQAINEYSWPGNVRELKNRIERIILLEDEELIEAHHFELAASAPGGMVGRADGEWNISLPPEGLPLEALEREILRRALERFNGNVSKAARYLSISRQTLIYRMKKHELGRARSDLKAELQDVRGPV